MNRLGVVADLSGSSPETVRRVLAVSRVPAFVSHPPQPLPDDLLRALRAAGGVCTVPCTPGTPRRPPTRSNTSARWPGPRPWR
ncbi:membrane dipeptidase [Streptomyces zhihengii]